MSLQIKEAQISPLNTHIQMHNYTHTLATNLTTDYTLCDVDTEDTIRHNIALITSTSLIEKNVKYPSNVFINIIGNTVVMGLMIGSSH